jgi:hypothetical protein
MEILTSEGWHIDFSDDPATSLIIIIIVIIIVIMKLPRSRE